MLARGNDPLVKYELNTCKGIRLKGVLVWRYVSATSPIAEININFSKNTMSNAPIPAAIQLYLSFTSVENLRVVNAYIIKNRPTIKNPRLVAYVNATKTAAKGIAQCADIFQNILSFCSKPTKNTYVARYANKSPSASRWNRILLKNSSHIVPTMMTAISAILLSLYNCVPIRYTRISMRIDGMNSTQNLVRTSEKPSLKKNATMKGKRELC